MKIVYLAIGVTSAPEYAAAVRSYEPSDVGGARAYRSAVYRDRRATLQVKFGFMPDPVKDDGPLSCEVTWTTYTNVGVKRVRTAPVRDRIVDDDKAYALVLRHVRECPKCSPDDVLKAYLERREALKRRARHGGRTSTGLCRLAEKYERIGADPALVRAFFVRSGDAGILCQRRDLTPEEAVDGTMTVWEAWGDDVQWKATRRGDALKEVKVRGDPASPVYPLLVAAATMYDAGAGRLEREELERLAEVALVMSS